MAEELLVTLTTFDKSKAIKPLDPLSILVFPDHSTMTKIEI